MGNNDDIVLTPGPPPLSQNSDIGRRDVPRTIMRSTTNESNHTTTSTVTENSVAEAVTISANGKEDEPQVCAERNDDNAVHGPDAGGQAAKPNRSSDMSFGSNSKRGSDDHLDSGRTHATGTVTHGSESWGWYEDVHHDTAVLSPTNKKGRDFGNEEIDENQDLSTSRRGGKRRGLLHFTMSNIKPLMDMVLSKHDQGKGKKKKREVLLVVANRGLLPSWMSVSTCIFQNFGYHNVFE